MKAQQFTVHEIEAELEKALDLHDRGDFAAAESLNRHILGAAPRNVVATRLAGLIAFQTGRNAEAEQFFARALDLDPGDAVASDYRGKALLNLGQIDTALACYDKALALAPRFPEAHNNRGVALYLLERYGEAIASYDAALALLAGYVEARFNRAITLLHLNHLTAALEDLDKVVAANPAFVEGHYNRGLALFRLGRFDEAVEAYDRALALKPDFLDALRNRGMALQHVNRHEEAAENYARLAVDDDRQSSLYVESACKMFYAQTICCDWHDYDATTRLVTEVIETASYPVQPFAFLLHSRSPALELKCARQYVAANFPASPHPLWQGERYAHDKIRVAYLSSDFRDHAVAYLAAELFELHDRQRFEIYGVSFWPDDKSQMRRRLERAFDRFIDVVERSDYDVAMMLRDLEVDIVVHLNGHTDPGRIPIVAHRPAPLQVNYLGYPGTMGADYIDYIIADRHVVPPEDAIYYSEKVAWLPDSYQANDTKRSIGPVPVRSDVGLPDEGFVFCGFNRNAKITPDIFDIWMRLLRRVKGSVLWLLANNDAAVRNLKQAAQERGIDPRRLIFAPFRKLEPHLARQTLADLCIDTLPYNAHTTASDALWAGVPVVTCQGQTFASRVAASLLHALGVPELVTETLADYEELAFTLATKPRLLAEVRAKIARNRSIAPLFDAPRYCRHIEKAYLTMWQRWQRGSAPESFAIEPNP